MKGALRFLEVSGEPQAPFVSTALYIKDADSVNDLNHPRVQGPQALVVSKGVTESPGD